MATRRGGASETASVAYQRGQARTEEQLAAINARMEANFDRIISEVGNLRTEVRAVDQRSTLTSDRLENRIADIERQVIDTRDEFQRAKTIPIPGRVQAARDAIHGAAKSWPAQVAAACLVFTTIVAALNNAPDGIRWAERIWTAFRDHPPAVKAAAVPEK